MARAAAPVISVPVWLKRRVALWQRRLNLNEWHIRIIMLANNKSDSKGGAQIAWTTWARGYTDAKIEFSAENYNSVSPALVDRMIVHELYHLVASREDDALEDMVGTGVVYKAYVKEQERIAEAFAYMMVKAYQRKRSI